MSDEPTGGVTDGRPAGSADEPAHLFPVSPSWFTAGFYLFLLGWLGYLLVQTAGYTKFEDYFFPFLVGVPLAGLLVLRLVTIRYPTLLDRFLPEDERTAAKADLEELATEYEVEEAARPAAERERWELYMLFWVALLPTMMYFLGMGWTIVIYTFALAMFLTRDLKRSLAVTAIVIVFIYVLFLQLLEMIIWQGTLGLPDPLSWLHLVI